MTFKLSAPIIFACALSTLIHAKTHYVSNSGSDGATGLNGAPWNTLQHAADMSGPGDSIIVKAGNYAGFQMGWDAPQNGTAALPIFFTADSGAIITSRNSKTADGIDLEGASYIVVEGFTITNSGGTITRAGIRAVVDTGVVIRRNVIDGMGTWGIITGHSERITIEYNTTSHSLHQHGIYFGNSADYPTIRGNVSFGNGGCGIHMNADVSQGGDGVITGALVENNIIYENGDSGGSAINCDGIQNSRIQNNLLYNNHASGISLFMTDAAEASKNDTVVNNTIVMASDGRWAVNINSGSGGCVLYNNILYNNHSFHGSIAIDQASLAGFKSDYNALMDRLSADGDNTTITLADWRSQTGQDLHSIIAAPTELFVNAASNDYHLKAGAPAIDKGTTADAPAEDIEGRARPLGTGVDIGAYEYASPSTISFAEHAGRSPAPTHALSVAGLQRLATGCKLSAVYNVQGRMVMRLSSVQSGLTPSSIACVYSLYSGDKRYVGELPSVK